ncbi:MAG: AsmA-like C-terminal region-containing protein, partial [Pseudomonadota bacterium]
MSLDGNVKSLRAAEARVVLDASRLAGSFSRREDEAGVDLRLDVDRLNLDQYRPADGAGTTVQWLTEHPFLVDLHDRLVADGIVGFRFAADELLVDEKRLSEVAGQGTIDGERLQLKNLSIAAFAQSAIRVAGHYRYAPPVEGSDEPVLEVTTSVVTEDVSGLADELVLSLPKFPQSPAAADLRVRVSGDPSALLKTSFSGTLGGFDVNVGGALDREGDPVWNGAVRLIHADAGAVFDAYLTDYDPPGATGPFDVFARLDGGQGDVTFNELIGKVGSLVLAGDGQVEWDPKAEQIKPVIEATLRTGAIDVMEWLPARRTRTVGIWPSDRLSLNWVNWADLDLRVVGREVIWDDITLEKPALTMTSENGVLEVSRFSADGWGGRLGLSGTLGPDEAGYGLDGRIDVVGVDAERFLGQTVGASGIDGALDFGATVGTRGTSIRDFVGGMDGSALISVREGQIENVDLAEAAQWVAADEEPVDFLNGLRGSLDEGVTPFQALNARMTVNQGRLHTDDLRIAAIETIGT